MYLEIIILDKIRSAYLAIRFQSRFAHSSGLPNNRIPKDKAKKDVEIFRDKVLFKCITSMLFWTRKTQIPLHLCDPRQRFTMLESLFTLLHGQNIPQYFKDISTFKNNIHVAKECSKIGEVPL